mgnify:CR=1
MTDPAPDAASAPLGVDVGEEELMTVQEVCGLLKVTKDWLYDQVEARQIPHVRLGRHVRFHPAQLRAYLQECSVPGPQGPALP